MVHAGCTPIAVSIFDLRECSSLKVGGSTPPLTTGSEQRKR
jgi:hypothetical protein